MHNTGIALIEVTQEAGPRIIVNNEEERFSGNKHTTEYPKASIDAMVATLRRSDETSAISRRSSRRGTIRF